MMEDKKSFQAPADLARWQTLALGIGGVLTVVIAIFFFIGAPAQKEQILRSWLLGFIFWGGIGVGCLGVLLLQYLISGAWGIVVRRVLEAGSRTIFPFLFILFLPIMIGVTQMYEWTHLPANDPTNLQRGIYQTPLWWTIRTVLYFLLWGVMAFMLNRWGQRQDEATNYTDAAKQSGDASKFSGPTMVFFVLVVTFSVVDWVMSLDPHWFSTMWGLLFVAGWGLSCFSFVVVILAALADKAPMNRVLGKRHFHDLGKLMLALVMVWAYFNFSQYLIIWSGNIPEETEWYITRTTGGWGWIGLIIIFFHFAFPFLVLLSRDIKRNSKWLALLAIFILVLRLVDMFYLIAPNPRIYPLEGFHVSIWDIIAPVAIGGLWLWRFFGELQKRPLVPVNDPFLENAIEHGKGH
ncbi:MAG: hypothetical protein WA584_18800 [Pyrinomonadaceae bacterium]